jgi:hypothetical protein
MVAAQSNHKFADTQIICKRLTRKKVHFIGDFPDTQFSYSQIMCLYLQIVLGCTARLLAESRLQRE